MMLPAGSTITLQIERAAMQGQIRTRVRASPALRETTRVGLTEWELRFQRIVEAAPHGILIVDLSGCIALANPKIGALFGYTLDELQGSSVETLTVKTL